MRKLSNSESILSFNNSSSTENLAALESKMALKKKLNSPEELCLHFFIKIMKKSVDIALENLQIAKTKEYARDFFEQCINCSTNLNSLSRMAPASDVFEMIVVSLDTENIPIPVDRENWNRGRITKMECSSKTKKERDSIVLLNGDITSNSNISLFPNFDRISGRKKSLHQRSIIHNQTESTINVNLNNDNDKNQTPTEAYPNQNHKMSQKIFEKTIIKLHQTRSMSLNSEIIEEELRNQKKKELISSFTEDSKILNRVKTPDKLKLKAKSKIQEKPSKLSESFNMNERTFGIFGEVKDFKSIKNDKIRPLLHQAKYFNKRCY
jgi:hypothetical protein